MVVEPRLLWRPDLGSERASFEIARLRDIAATRRLDAVVAGPASSVPLYNRLAPSPSLDDLLGEIDRDPACIFWG